VTFPFSVIPAKAGIHGAAGTTCGHQPATSPRVLRRRHFLPIVSLAAPWIPAFAGMTKQVDDAALDDGASVLSNAALSMTFS